MFDILVEQAEAGIRVHLAVTDDEINQSPQSPAFHLIEEAGGRFFRISQALMHHKFCIIDGQTIITGSYNWSYQARKNYENITVAREAPLLAMQFYEEFARMTGQAPPQGTDTSQIRTRLETLRNLIQLDEWDLVHAQIPRLRQLDIPESGQLIANLEARQESEALSLLQALLHRLGQLVRYQDPQIDELRLAIMILTWEIEGLEAEIADTGRIIYQYTHRHHLEVGEVLARILQLRRDIEYLKIQIDEIKGVSPEEKAEQQQQYEEAQSDYQSYQEEKQSYVGTTVSSLTEEEKKSLKKRYRKAASLCHPDRVHESLQVRAQEIFIHLQKAYESNNLDQVTEIYQALEQGVYDLKSRTVELSRLEQLQAERDHLSQKRSSYLAELRALQEHSTWQTITEITDWDAHFQQLREQLTIQAGILEKQRNQLQQEIEHEQA